jgi:hypothetical protein
MSDEAGVAGSAEKEMEGNGSEERERVCRAQEEGEAMRLAWCGRRV